jgi:hypothetical protein
MPVRPTRPRPPSVPTKPTAAAAAGAEAARRPAASAASRVEARYQRIVKILELALAAAGRSRWELDAALGHARGYSSRLFAGRAPLKVRDLLRAVEVLGLAPGQMFGPLVLGRGAPAGPGERPPGEGGGPAGG